MLTAAGLQQKQASGIRRVKLGQDLGAIADLIERCFSPRLDAGGRATIREMRALSHLGPLLGLLALADTMLKGIEQGFVWEEAGQIVGNVTLYPADYPPELGRTIIVANVAVDPDHRRRGIARRLMEAALEATRAGGAARVILQVEADNAPAVKLYEGLGFHIQRTWHHWRRNGELPGPERPRQTAQIGPRPAGRWKEEYALAALAFPQERGGLGWQRPLHPREFRRSAARQTVDFLSGTLVARWVAQEGGQIVGALWARAGLTSASTQLTLIVHPARRGSLEGALLSHGMWQLAGGYRPLSAEHPADDQAATEAFQRYGFTSRRTLHYMALEF